MHHRDACPLCGREMQVPRHRHHTAWTPQSKLWASRLREVGFPVKGVARLLGTTEGALMNMWKVSRRPSGDTP